MIKINKLVLKFDTSMRVDKSLITNIFQYSQAKLVVLLTSITSNLGFSWVTPSGYQFEERSLAYDPDENIAGYYAYSATIYPGFTIGFPQNIDTSFCIVSVRKGTTRSPLIRVPVDRTIEPTLTELPESNYTELAARVLDLEAFADFDINDKANLDGGNSFTGNQSVNGTIHAYGAEIENITLKNVYMNNYPIKDVGSGTLASDAANIGDVQSAIVAHDGDINAHAELFAEIPIISTNISEDAQSDVKTASPKSVKTYVDNAVSIVDTKANLNGGNHFNGNQSVNGTISAYGGEFHNISVISQLYKNNTKIVGLAAGTASTDAANIGNVQSAVAAHDASPTAHADLFANVYTKSETYSKTEVNNLVSSVYKYRGTVSTYANLAAKEPTSVVGDVWEVIDSGINYAWNGSFWDDIGGVEALATLTNNGLMSKEDFAKLSGIEGGAEVNVIEEIVVNGTPLVPTAKSVSITVPTDLSELANSTGLFANDNIIEEVKVNGVALTPTAKSVDISVPTDVNDLTDNSSLLGDANIIEGIIVDTVTLTPDGNKKVTIPAANTTNQDGLITWENNAKLAGIETGAQVNDLESVKVGGSTLGIASKAVDIVSVPVTTTTPVGNWTGAGYKIAILSSDPATKYTGWIYIITT